MAGKVHAVVFDKTGTLTEGAPILKEIINIEQKFKVQLPLEQGHLTDKELIIFTYLTESSSDHPLAKTIVK